MANRRSIRINPTVDTTLHTAGDQVTQLFTIPMHRRGGVINAITVLDKAEQSAPLELLLFDGPVTVAANNAAAAFSDADLANKLVGVLEIAAADMTVELGGVGVQSMGSIRNIGLGIKPRNGEGRLYGCLRTTGTPTYAAADDLVLVFDIEDA